MTTKIHLVCDSNGFPLTVMLSPGEEADSCYFMPLLEQISLPGSRGRPRKRCRYVLADKVYAIAGLGAGLASLEPPQRQDLVTAAIGLADEEHKASAIAGLGARLASLEPSQRQALVEAALEIDHNFSKVQAIAGLVNGYQASKVRGIWRSNKLSQLGASLSFSG